MAPTYLIQSQDHETCSQKAQITPTRFWRWFDEDEFESNFGVVASGHFGEVRKATFKGIDYLESKKQSTTYAGQQVALKDPKGGRHNFVQETYSLSHEVSCTLILHPAFVNYIGGVDLGSGLPDDRQRVGIVMEYVGNNLRDLINSEPRLRERKIQLHIAKQICSGMNFLHSLNPRILHCDLRPPNILVTENFDCKIADFGISNNLVYQNFKEIAMYTSLIPPEAVENQRNFSTKGDVYFYGWLLAELISGKQPQSYDVNSLKEEIDLVLKEEEDKSFKEMTLNCLNQDPTQRYSFQEILVQLNSLLECPYDIEVIVQNNFISDLKKGLNEKVITPSFCDALGRNIIHQCCIFGNLEMLEYLVRYWGEYILQFTDKFNTTLIHLAARSGYLNILKYLQEKNIGFNEKENRFQTSGLDLAIAMKHWDCVEFLISKANQQTLDSALLSASSEGNLELVKKLVVQGANLECRTLDTEATPLERASHNGHLPIVVFLIEKGATVNSVSKSGCTPLFIAAQNGHKEVAFCLLHCGADPNQACTDDGSTPLFIAAQNDRREIVELLLQHGADPEKARTDSEISPLFISAQEGNREIVQLLLKFNANPNKIRKDNTSPLIMASVKGNSDVVDLLLKYGANPNHLFNGYNALYWAHNQNQYDVVNLLIQYVK